MTSAAVVFDREGTVTSFQNTSDVQAEVTAWIVVAIKPVCEVGIVTVQLRKALVWLQEKQWKQQLLFFHWDCLWHIMCTCFCSGVVVQR